MSATSPTLPSHHHSTPMTTEVRHCTPSFKGLVALILGSQVLLQKKNEERALKYFKLADEENCLMGKTAVAFFSEFRMGEGPQPVSTIPKENYTLAERLYTMAASRGCGLAKARLAFLKTHGRPGIKINHAEAERWRKECAEQGKDAIRWLEEAAEAGIAAAQFCLALCYYNGIAVPEDDAVAFLWCEKAANQGHSGAQNVLGNLYIEGSGCTRNPTLGLRWYIKAAEQREAAAIYNIGTLFERGIAVEEDLSQALGWYQRAAKFGSINAQNVLGIFYEQGLGMSGPNEIRAVEHYLLAAKDGHPHAQYNLGRCYHDGIGVRTDNALAAGWFQHAAAQNHALSQLSLGICYEYGMGVPQNNVMSLQNYTLAASNGCEEANKRIRPVVAVKMLAPARVLLSNKLSPASSPSSRPTTIHSLPLEILEHIIGYLDDRRLLSPREHRVIFKIAADKRTMTGSMSSKLAYLDLLGLKELALGQLPLPKCTCFGGTCKEIKHIVDAIENFQPAMKSWDDLLEVGSGQLDVAPAAEGPSFYHKSLVVAPPVLTLQPGAPTVWTEPSTGKER
ncbi:uncharacterized protein SPPG_05869 [Spizellomyces punctatus DAOM BR117]|uniref:F-box domain-containing protein n=1 Tax=Spizellomyces punctatus (strain DAOM BR117) TaxID=645134 RepID=A0A0L0HD59_SPIPD|nr:uncharacterized protein SPPG_05869 [Spizellomyces punctatus DAOM BR117]KNC98904.1 hypothetical protein SPPG_05869 [Spizellomyces punctatus DAOM BR117]|eukprot:XP_016606944.1 hypothetical protein SPPG_05869 [Spizellomyces punctatus DAOM BR117]